MQSTVSNGQHHILKHDGVCVDALNARRKRMQRLAKRKHTALHVQRERARWNTIVVVNVTVAGDRVTSSLVEPRFDITRKGGTEEEAEEKHEDNEEENEEEINT